MNKARVHLVEDNAIVLESLRKIINREPDLSVVGESMTGQTAVEAVGGNLPDICVIDLGLPDMPGIDVIRKIREKSGAVRILVLSMMDELIYGVRAFAVGANGYLMKQDAVDDLIPAMRCILSGGSHMSEPLKACLASGALASRRQNQEAP